ncbi:MAG: light-harvesting antenna LH1, beta subunit [Parvularculaceae bacterium]
MASDTPQADTMSGLTPQMAQEFHKAFVMNFIVFTGIAILAHLLVWIWRPWIPGEAGWEASSLEGAIQLVGSFAQIL